MDGLFIRENPSKMDDLGIPLFLETPIYFISAVVLLQWLLRFSHCIGNSIIRAPVTVIWLDVGGRSAICVRRKPMKRKKESGCLGMFAGEILFFLPWRPWTMKSPMNWEFV